MKLLQTTKSKLIVASLVVLIAGFAGGYAYYRSNDATSETQGSPEASNDSLNLNPPTDEEKQAGDRQKEKLNSEESQRSQSGTVDGIKKVTPIITSWEQSTGKVEVAARVPGVLEDNGLCTLRLTKAGKTVTGTRKGVSNVSEVSCGYIAIPRSQLSPGTWSGSVTYSSSVAKGTSKTININVQ